MQSTRQLIRADSNCGQHLTQCRLQEPKPNHEQGPSAYVLHGHRHTVGDDHGVTRLWTTLSSSVHVELSGPILGQL